MKLTTKQALKPTRSTQVTTLLASLALFAITFVSLTINAQSLASNTDQPVLGVVPNVNSSAWVAAAFHTGVDPAQLASISLYEWTFGSPHGSFFVSIYGDNNGLPGSSLAGGALTGLSSPQGAGFQTYTASQPLSLAANTLYWVVATSDNETSGEDNYSWAPAQNTTYTSAFGWTFYDQYADTFDQAQTWDLYGGIQNGYGPLLLEIDGAVVPEPTTFALFIMAAGTLPFRFGRRDKIKWII